MAIEGTTAAATKTPRERRSKITPEARALLDEEVSRRRAKLLALAGNGDEVVRQRDVLQAIAQLNSNESRAARPRLLADWSKRFTFVVLGFTINQILVVFGRLRDDLLVTEDIVWLVGGGVVSGGLIALSLVLDIGPRRGRGD